MINQERMIIGGFRHQNSEKSKIEIKYGDVEESRADKNRDKKRIEKVPISFAPKELH